MLFQPPFVTSFRVYSVIQTALIPGLTMLAQNFYIHEITLKYFVIRTVFHKTSVKHSLTDEH